MEIEEEVFRVNQYSGQGIAVITSGGDSQGMNPTLRAIVRIGLYVGCKIYYIREGYNGLIAGGENIIEATWDSVSSIIHKGGTVIGTARCKEFTTVEGKLKAAKNMVQRGISNLIIIGGDGSLTGADLLRKQWNDLLDKLQNAGEITGDQVKKFAHLRVVGLVGTIDNDFAGTDMTIGADSALHRIQEAVYAIASTAYSHKRTFILEVMGRHCGYLALKTALTTEADYVFIPEMPPPNDWPSILERRITSSSQMGKRLHLIILAEGARDHQNNPITGAIVQEVLISKLNLDARVTVLGHVQRGGSPSAFDRILGSRSGADAVIALMELKPDDEPIVIAFNANKIKRIPLNFCIEQMKKQKEAISANNNDLLIKLRGRSFFNNIEIYKILNQLEFPTSDDHKGPNFAVLQVGTPAGGMNAAVYSFVRNSIYKGGKVYGIFGGIEGFISGNFREMKWSDVYGLIFEGGSYLGTKRMVPPEDSHAKIAENLRKFKIVALLIIGGFEAFVTANNLTKQRESFREFCIPIVVIPATTSNNVPGTDFCIGADTALNAIVKICDLFRQSALGTKSRVFIVETMGGRCGYLCSMGGLASGADSAYIYEEPFNINDLSEDVRHMISKMKSGGVLRGLVLRNECCNDNYTTDFLMKLYAEEGKGVFTTRKNILGHIQQGDIPSTFDRSLAVKLSIKASEWFYEQLAKYRDANGNVYVNSQDSAIVIGLTVSGYCHTPIQDLLQYTDFHNRFSHCKWWMNFRNLFRTLALHPSTYETYAKN